jgi:hypothetical protein
MPPPIGTEGNEPSPSLSSSVVGGVPRKPDEEVAAFSRCSQLSERSLIVLRSANVEIAMQIVIANNVVRFIVYLLVIDYLTIALLTLVLPDW